MADDENQVDEQAEEERRRVDRTVIRRVGDQLQVGPGQGDSDDRDGQRDGGGEMGECEPPAGEDDPDDVADRGGCACVCAAHELAAEGPQCEVGHAERREARAERAVAAGLA